MFDILGFRHYLTGPSGCAEAMGFSMSEAMGSSGVLRNIFIWLWERVVTYDITYAGAYDIVGQTYDIVCDSIRNLRHRRFLPTC